MFFDKTKEGKDPIYRRVCDSDSSRVEQLNQEFEELWLKFKPYADKGFKQLFRDDVVSRFWEMYLGALLIQQKKKLSAKNNYGPDICIIENDGRKIWLEATAPDKGEGNDKVNLREEFGWVPTEKVLLRVRSAIEAKHHKYLNYLKEGLINDSEPYIIAINASKLGYRDTPDPIDTPKILNVVFGIGDFQVSISQTGNIVGSGYTNRKEIKKKSGSPVETDIFFKKEYASISAIIYSDIGPFNYDPDLGFDIKLVHNPNAKNPINRGWLMRGIEYYLESNFVKSTNWNE